MKDITQRSICEHREALSSGEYSSLELTKAYLDKIKEKDGEIGAYLTVTEEKALKSAAEVDKKRAAGEALSPVAGIPMAIKDNICTKGVRTTCASKMLADYIPPYDAHVTERLKQADAIILGKLNMDEFAMGSSTENSAFKVTRNPRDLTRVPGGSSGGSAAAVASGEACYTLGSDTGGSIRQPAAFCGVVGMKPTYGSVSRYGLVAFASSLDQIGPLTSTVRDNAEVLNIISGLDERDATSIRRDYPDLKSELDAGVSGLRIGIPDEFFGDGIDGEVKQAVMDAARLCEKLGATLTKVSMPTVKYALAAYYVLSSAEASSNLARFDGVRYGYRAEEYADMTDLYKKSRSEGFGDEVKRRIMLGTFALSSGYCDAYYNKALKVRSLVMKDYSDAFEKCDLILSPVAPTTAYRIGEKTNDPLQMYLGDAYSVPVNIAGIPALSMPCGKDKSGLPIGMQLMGKAFSEPLLYRVGHTFEKEREVTL